MSSVNYMIPKNNREIWHPALLIICMVDDNMLQIPLLGWVTAGITQYAYSFSCGIGCGLGC